MPLASSPGKDGHVIIEVLPSEVGTIDHIHTVSKLIEVSREYKKPHVSPSSTRRRLSTQMEVVMEALDNQGVPTQYTKIPRELYSNFTTKISPFYKNIIHYHDLNLT
ncbi:hypothetical protein RB195_004503 [Necator americanus]|uniref:Uncharacterized protein n=1 Tax=Necator americanus TaxID=51031 RepID=A0ABR1BMC7_NECAM